MSAISATVGPFTWVKRDQGTDAEAWDLQGMKGVLPNFCVKNYGGTPGPGFRGWKLVSGGPFDSAGAYATFDEAVAGVVPYLVALMEREIASKLAEIEQQKAVLEAAKASMEGWTP